MDDSEKRDAILFDIHFALRQKIRPKVKWQSEIRSHIAAKTILAHLELCGWQFTRKPQSANHSTPDFTSRKGDG